MEKIKENHSFSIGDTFTYKDGGHRKIISKRFTNRGTLLYSLEYESQNKGKLIFEIGEHTLIDYFEKMKYTNYTSVKKSAKLYPIY